MRGKIFLFLFALPFFGVGAWMGYSIGCNLVDAWQMKQWEPVQANLLRAGYETHDGDDSDTYEAYARYTYVYRGQEFTNDRVAIAGGADNIGDFHTDTGRHLSRAMGNGEQITIYVNPEDPSQAVIHRSLRWGLIGFKSIFFFVFGGVGLGLIVLVFRAPKEKDLSLPEYLEQPWLANDDWQTATVKSNSKAAMYFAWGFAAIWNMISAPLPFLVYQEVLEKENYAALLGILFPVVGIGLLVWAVRRTLEWRRFGPAPVTLDPFPGSIGGHVGGTIDVRLPFESGTHFTMALTLIHSYMSGSGKNRSRRESAEWQDNQVAHAASGAIGSRLSFRFDVPDNLEQSDAARNESSYYLWRLNLKAELDGIDIDRDYEIPVFPTRQQSSELSALSIEQAQNEQGRIDTEAIRKIVNVSYDASGKKILYPAGRNMLSGFSGFIFGSIFAGIGWFLLTHEGHVFMGSVFGGVGLIILISSLYFVLNSLEVTQEGGKVKTIRRILGIPVKQMQMRRADFIRFKKKSSSKTQSGNKHVIHYSVSVIDSIGQKMVVGEGFRGAGQADAAADYIAREFGLSATERAPEPDLDLDDINFLAAE